LPIAQLYSFCSKHGGSGLLKQLCHMGIANGGMFDALRGCGREFNPAAEAIRGEIIGLLSRPLYRISALRNLLASDEQGR